MKASELYRDVLEEPERLETESAVYEQNTQEATGVEKLHQAYQRALSGYDYTRTDRDEPFSPYQHIEEDHFLDQVPDDFKKILKRMDYTADELYEFCDERIIEPEDDFAGVFISLAAELAPEETVTLPDMSHYNQIGYENTQELIVEGDVGNHLGGYQEGNITVKGSAKDCLGHTMHDGTITVEGNAGRRVGQVMTGGEIEIKGDAGEEIGMHLLPEPEENPEAEITLHGEGEPHDCPGAKIFKVQNGSKQQIAP